MTLYVLGEHSPTTSTTGFREPGDDSRAGAGNFVSSRERMRADFAGQNNNLRLKVSADTEVQRSLPGIGKED